jgi:hypothetical protein
VGPSKLDNSKTNSGLLILLQDVWQIIVYLVFRTTSGVGLVY